MFLAWSWSILIFVIKNSLYLILRLWFYLILCERKEIMWLLSRGDGHLGEVVTQWHYYDTIKPPNWSSDGYLINQNISNTVKTPASVSRHP